MNLRFKIFEPHSKSLDQGLVMDLGQVEGAVMADQIHTDQILEVQERPDEAPQCDAFITQQKGLPLMVKVADCQGVLMYDPKTETVASVHSGWRGSALNIIGKTILRMRRDFGVNPKNLLVAIGPSLGPCCAEFSDPKNELPEFCHPFILPNQHVDFWNLSLAQCQMAGVPARQVEVAGQCTKCQPGFYSHRNGDRQRMGIFAKLQ